MKHELSPVASIQIQEVTSKNEQHRFIEALELAEKTRRSAGITLDDGFTSRLYFEMAYSHYFLSNYRKALLKLRVAIKFCGRDNDFELLGKLRNLCGLVLQQLGRLNEAEEEHLQAYVFRKQLGQHALLAPSLNNLGLVHLVKGSLIQAEEQFLKAVLLASKYNSAEILLTSQLNLALALVLRGEFKRSCELLRSIRSQSHDSFVESRLLHRDGLRLALQLSFKAAFASLTRCLKTSRTLNDSRFILVCLEYLGLNEYFAGNYQKAKDYYQQVLDMPEPTASAVAQTLRMLTDVHIAEGHWELAKQTAAKAEAAITKISERIELGALWRAYGHIHAHDGNRDEARAFFTKSIELLRQLGARYELALSYFDAGRSEVFSTSERMEHLRTARSLFVDMDVPKRVVQVDAAIKQLEADCHPGERRNQASTTVLRVAA